MRCIEATARYEIWEVGEAHGSDFYVYDKATGGDPRVVPSLGMARAIAVKA